MTKVQVVIAEGDPGDRLYVIVDEKIKLGRTSNDGWESLLAVLGPGDMFGELYLFDPGLRTATDLTETTLLGLVHEASGPWLTGRPRVAEALLKTLGQRLSRTNENLSDLVFSEVPGRVGKAGVELNKNLAKNGQKVFCWTWSNQRRTCSISWCVSRNC